MWSIMFFKRFCEENYVENWRSQKWKDFPTMLWEMSPSSFLFFVPYLKYSAGIEITIPTTYHSHPAKIDLNRKWLPKQKTIQNFFIDAQVFRKTRNENPPKQKIGATS